jgi:hypothetical protein
MSNTTIQVILKDAFEYVIPPRPHADPNNPNHRPMPSIGTCRSAILCTDSHLKIGQIVTFESLNVYPSSLDHFFHSNPLYYQYFAGRLFKVMHGGDYSAIKFELYELGCSELEMN